MPEKARSQFHVTRHFAGTGARWFVPMVCLCLLLSTRSDSGTHDRSSFTVTGNGSTDSSLVLDGGLRLGVQRYDIVKIFGDAQLSNSPSKYSAVAARTVDTFSYFWTDSLGIFKYDVILDAHGIVPEAPPLKIKTYASLREVYLQADYGPAGYLVSYLERAGASSPKIMAFNGTSTLAVDSAQWFLYTSQCHASADTFFLAYSVDMERVKLRKIYSNGSDLRVLSTDTVAVSVRDTSNALTNCGVATDDQGRILVTWLRGGPNHPKYLYYALYDRALDKVAGGSLAQPVSDNSLTYYEDAPVVSYASGKFAAVSWNAGGIMLHEFNARSGLSVSSKQLFDLPGARYSTIVANKNFVSVACWGDVDGNGKRGIEGVRYRIAGDSLGIRDTFPFSNLADSVVIRDRYSTAINCAMDTSGSIALTWRHQFQVQGALWANRAIRHRRGFWTSPVESLPVQPGDSVRFYPATVEVTSLTSWYVEDSIRIACSPADFTANLPSWTSLSNAQLAATPGTCRYFQYRLALGRTIPGGTDSISSAQITSISIPWNAQPVFVTLDTAYVNGARRVVTPFGSTITVLSRSDSVKVYLTMRDADPGDRLTLGASWPARQTSAVIDGGPLYYASVQMQPIAISGTTAICTLDLKDTRNWRAVPRTISIQTRNSVPLLDLRAVRTNEGGAFDTSQCGPVSRFEIQEQDSIAFLYSVADTNDSPTARCLVSRWTNATETKLDSVEVGPEKRFCLRGDTLTPVDSVVLRFTASDPDTSVYRTVVIIVNHTPRISKVIYGEKVLSNGDTLRIVVGDSTRISVEVTDADLAYWDTLTGIFRTRAFSDSIISTGTILTYPFTPARADSVMTITIHDRYGMRDSVTFFMRFPWFDTISSNNPEYWSSRDSLLNHFSLIVGSRQSDSITLPLRNSGNDTMSIVSIRFRQKSQTWLAVGVPQDTGMARFTSFDAGEMKPVTLMPDSVLAIRFYCSVASLRGDGLIYDTLILGTSDPAHPFDTIPIRLEFNDLPRLVSISPDFIPDMPYMPKFAKKKKSLAYRFPPHATIALQFSEPMDSVSAAGAIKIFSARDLATSGDTVTINVTQTWSQNYTKLNISANYQTASAHFSLIPPKGLFIPTDVLRIQISSDLTDTASTPNGPNNLDVNRDYSRDSGADTVITMSVDSISFSILSVDPAPDDSLVSSRTAVSIQFSSEVFAASVDTALAANRTLIVHSRYSGDTQLAFDSIRIDNSTVRFYLSRAFFYRDSISCYYRAGTVRDMMGFTIDNSDDGIPGNLFDTASTVDDAQWSFRIKPIALVSVSPESASTVENLTPPVKLVFSDPVPEGIFDLDTTARNRSFRMGSGFGGERWTSYSKIEFSGDRKQITLIPTWKFFSNDSVHCHFVGFSKEYRYTRTDNLPHDTSAKFSELNWYFRTGSVGFYTFPNPYKPSRDARHCTHNGPCGIWFKNLHVLRSGVREVRIAIRTIKGFAVYDTEKAGYPVIFESGNENRKPHWLWNTRNLAGEEVASGLYFYTVHDRKTNDVLVKGKLMIVR